MKDLYWNIVFLVSTVQPTSSSLTLMASADDNRHRRRHPAAHFTGFLHAAAANLSSFLPPKAPYPPSPSSKIHLPLLLPDSILSLTSPSDSAPPQSPSTNPPSPSPSSIRSAPSSETASGFPSTIRISSGKGGGPAFVGQVFSMCDLSGTGLMAVSTHFDIPFLSKRYCLGFGSFNFSNLVLNYLFVFQ